MRRDASERGGAERGEKVEGDHYPTVVNPSRGEKSGERELRSLIVRDCGISEDVIAALRKRFGDALRV
ncbi:MAG: hypothetical protein AB7V46_21570 [Thermomicrobiales bacterium]